MIQRSTKRALMGGLVLCAGLAVGLSASPVLHAAQSEASAQEEQVKVIYHINNSEEQALTALRNMRNHLDVAPETKIVLVAHAEGIDFLRTDYEDAETVGPLVAGLAARGVSFEVCEITISRNDLSHDDFVLEADFTPSGVARIAHLQTQEHYAYIKP